MEANQNKLWWFFRRDKDRIIVQGFCSKAKVTLVDEKMVFMNKSEQLEIDATNKILSSSGEAVSVNIKGQFATELTTAINSLKW